MNPAFRKAIYDLPLCKGSLNNPTQFVKGGARKMLLEIQRLFVMLQCCDRKAFSTTDLTKSFGWGEGDHEQQQDVQEFNRVLFDAIESALKGTDRETMVDDMFFGDLAGYLTCHTCKA